MASSRIYTVRPGDTLSKIAKQAGVSTRTLARSNGLQNVNLIHVGQRLIIPSSSPSGAASTGGETRLAGGKLVLTAEDVINIKKTVKTEWVPSAGVVQAHGIIDTILNRVASGVWGHSVSSVVNARNQFSDINGPIARRKGRARVEDFPANTISTSMHQVVDAYLAKRTKGQPSCVGTHLNYANPHRSDKKNLVWINALEGPVLGKGHDIHRHGTTADLQRRRPGPFQVVLPNASASTSRGLTLQPPSFPPSGKRVNGNAVAAANGVSVKGSGVRIGHLAPEMELAIRAVADAARRLNLPTPVITSGNDGRHGSHSLHYADRGLDFRGNNISIAQGHALQNAVREVLGSRYDVLFEIYKRNFSNNHLHVEYDPN